MLLLVKVSLHDRFESFNLDPGRCGLIPRAIGPLPLVESSALVALHVALDERSQET